MTSSPSTPDDFAAASADVPALARAPLGIIGGSAFLESAEVAGARLREVDTPEGTVTLHAGADFVFLRRHGEGVYRPPHRIPHHAHVLALESLGVRQVAAFASTGSLHEALRPGDVLVPDDYLSWHPPPTFARDDYLHIVPALDPAVRELLIGAAEAALAGGSGAEGDREGGAAVRVSGGGGGGCGDDNSRRGGGRGGGSGGGSSSSSGAGREGGGRAPALERAGVYVEMRGPRFETPAEVRMLANHGHVAGMTAASEATLFQERGIGYAVVCIVDNWANGIGSPPLTLERFQAQLARSASFARAVLAELLRLWREPPASGARPGSPAEPTAE